MVPDFLKDHGAFIFKNLPLSWCHIPEDLNPQPLCCENLKSHSTVFDGDMFDIIGMQVLVLLSIYGLLISCSPILFSLCCYIVYFNDMWHSCAWRRPGVSQLFVSDPEL
jgi:hypothetical protein